MVRRIILTLVLPLFLIGGALSGCKMSEPSTSSESTAASDEISYKCAMCDNIKPAAATAQAPT